MVHLGVEELVCRADHPVRLPARARGGHGAGCVRQHGAQEFEEGRGEPRGASLDPDRVARVVHDAGRRLEYPGKPIGPRGVQVQHPDIALAKPARRRQLVPGLEHGCGQRDGRPVLAIRATDGELGPARYQAGLFGVDAGPVHAGYPAGQRERQDQRRETGRDHSARDVGTVLRLLQNEIGHPQHAELPAIEGSVRHTQVFEFAAEERGCEILRFGEPAEKGADRAGSRGCVQSGPNVILRRGYPRHDRRMAAVLRTVLIFINGEDP